MTKAADERRTARSYPQFIHRFEHSSEVPPPLTLLLLHGTGGDENDLIPLGRELSPRAALLGPRGKVLENGMVRFFRRLAEGVFDVDDLKFRTNELSDFVEAASRIYAFDPKRIVAVGLSNGANLAASMLLIRPKLLAGAVLFRPMVPFMPENTPDLSTSRILILAGMKDQIVPREQPRQLLELFQACHADVTLHWEDSTHGTTKEEIKLAKEWLSTNFIGASSQQE